MAMMCKEMISTTDFWGGRIDKNEIPDGNDWAGKGALYASYDKIKKPYPYGRFVFDKAPVTNELTAITQVVGSNGACYHVWQSR